jgi:CRISPR/Cas system-associated endonuclease Cas1
MKIVIDDFGAYLKKKGKRLVVVSGEKREEFPAEKVEQVMILKGSAITTDAIEWCRAGT